MNQFIERLIAMLKESAKIYICDDGSMRVAIPKNKAISIVNQLAEEYNNGWIPCSESVPKERNRYLVTYESGNIGIMEYITEKDWITKREWGWNGMCGDNRVIAWQPLPVPYQPKGE